MTVRQAEEYIERIKAKTPNKLESESEKAIESIKFIKQLDTLKHYLQAPVSLKKPEKRAKAPLLSIMTVIVPYKTS